MLRTVHAPGDFEIYVHTHAHSTHTCMHTVHTHSVQTKLAPVGCFVITRRLVSQQQLALWVELVVAAWVLTVHRVWTCLIWGGMWWRQTRVHQRTRLRWRYLLLWFTKYEELVFQFGYLLISLCTYVLGQVTRKTKRKFEKTLRKQWKKLKTPKTL